MKVVVKKNSKLKSMRKMTHVYLRERIKPNRPLNWSKHKKKSCGKNKKIKLKKYSKKIDTMGMVEGGLK